jgi:hypothetical protein
MKSWRFRYALTVLTLSTLPAGCGGSQPPIGASDAMPLTSAIATHADRSKAWMLPEAKNDELFYLADEYSVVVFGYAGKRVGAIERLISPGVCSDSRGDVWITSQGTISEYAHGGTTPIAQLTAPGQTVSCAVNPATNDLAVTVSPNVVAVFRNASGEPQTYVSPERVEFAYCAYDGDGNLYVDGRRSRREGSLEELPSGGTSLTPLSIGKKLAGPGGLQWDGAFLAVGDERNNVVYQVAIGSGYGTIENTLHFPAWRRHKNYQFWIHDSVIAFMYSRLDYGFWSYPAGGHVIHKFRYAMGTTGGNALSLAP